MNNLYDILCCRLALALSTRSLDLRREDGQTMAEYALIVSLVAAVLIIILIAIGTSVTGLFSSTSNKI